MEQASGGGTTEHGGSCVESRDDVYTALRGSSCLRFDLVINTFCGGEVSGARDMTPEQLNAVRGRMEGVLHTVRFEPNTKGAVSTVPANGSSR